MISRAALADAVTALAPEITNACRIICFINQRGYFPRHSQSFLEPPAWPVVFFIQENTAIYENRLP